MHCLLLYHIEEFFLHANIIGLLDSPEGWNFLHLLKEIIKIMELEERLPPQYVEIAANFVQQMKGKEK